MKKIVSDYAKRLGGTTQYSGNTKTMYINDPQQGKFKSAILLRFFDLPFKIITNKK